MKAHIHHCINELLQPHSLAAVSIRGAGTVGLNLGLTLTFPGELDNILMTGPHS